MRKLILPDRFKKKGRLAYYTLAHKTGAMVLVGFYLDNSIDPNSFFVNYFAQCLYAPFSTYNFSLGNRLGSYWDINRMSELQDKLNEFDVFDKLNTFEGFLLFLKNCMVLFYFCILATERVVWQVNMCILQKFEPLPDHYLY